MAALAAAFLAGAFLAAVFLVDVDFAAWYLRQHPEPRLRLVDEFVSDERWSIGLAVRADDKRLREQISQAVETCLQRAEFIPVFAKYGLTHRAPLVEIKAADAAIVQKVPPGDACAE